MQHIRNQADYWGVCGRQKKKCYPSNHIARKMARQASKRSGDKLRVYNCPHCGHWHMTKTKKITGQ